jgi:hypothetical protein
MRSAQKVLPFIRGSRNPRRPVIRTGQFRALSSLQGPLCPSAPARPRQQVSPGHTSPVIGAPPRLCVMRSRGPTPPSNQPQ